MMIESWKLDENNWRDHKRILQINWKLIRYNRHIISYLYFVFFFFINEKKFSKWNKKLIFFLFEINIKKWLYFFHSSGLQAIWTICPLGSNSLRVTINNLGTLNFYSLSNVATLLPLQFPLPLISDVSFQFSFLLKN
jgi:hypothetical protein